MSMCDENGEWSLEKNVPLLAQETLVFVADKTLSQHLDHSPARSRLATDLSTNLSDRPRLNSDFAHQAAPSKAGPKLWQYVCCLIASMANVSVYSLLQIWSAYASALQTSYDLDAQKLNSLYSTMNFGACMFSWMPGFVFDFYGPVATGLSGGVLTCLGLSLCLLETQQLIGPVGLRIGFFLLGLGGTFYQINGVLACLKCFPAERAGAVSACVLCGLALAMTGHSMVYEAFFLDDFVAFLWYEVACAVVALVLAVLVFGILCGTLFGGNDPSEIVVSAATSQHITPLPRKANPTPFSPMQISRALQHRAIVDSCPGTPGPARRRGEFLNSWFEGMARKAFQGPGTMCRIALPSKPSQHSLLNLARVEEAALEIEAAGPEDETVRDLRRALRALVAQRPHQDFGRQTTGAESGLALPGPSMQRSQSAPDLQRERPFPGAPTFAEMAQPGAFRRDYLAPTPPSNDDKLSGPAWAGAPPLTQLLATGHDFWARLSPPLPLREMLLERARLLSSPQFLFLVAVFVGPLAWVFSYLGVVAGMGAKLGMQNAQVVRLSEMLGLASAVGRLLLGVPPDFVHGVSRDTFMIVSISFVLVGIASVLAQPSISSLWVCSILVMVGYGGMIALAPGCLRAGLGMRYVGFLYGILFLLLGIALMPWSSRAVESAGCTTMDDCYGAWLRISSVSSVGVILSGLLFICCR